MTMLVLSRLLNPATSPPLSCILRSYNSWASAIRNASSPHEAMHLYTQMQRESIPFNSFTILFTLKSYGPLRDLTVIRHLHAHILKFGFQTHVYVATCLIHAYSLASFSDARHLFDETPERNTVTWNTMISGYSKLGDVGKARLIFEEMPSRDMVSWSALVAGYINNGKWNQGMYFFREMVLNEQLRPDQVTLRSALSGCARMGYLGVQAGKSLHAFVVRNEWELNVELGTALVDMYAKGGFLKNASRVFESMKERNVMSWTTLICGSAQQGYGNEAISIFEMMRKMGVEPNEVTFTGILSACAQTGLIEEGRKYFNMIGEYGLDPKVQHYGCMVDMFAKAGQLQDAYEMIKTMKVEPNVVVWGSFLSACKLHKQVEMAEKVIEHVLSMIEPENDGGVYTLISDLYALSGKWNDVERVRKLMVRQNAKKLCGSSSVGHGKRD